MKITGSATASVCRVARPAPDNTSSNPANDEPTK